jgi:hypothetical protein
VRVIYFRIHNTEEIKNITKTTIKAIFEAISKILELSTRESIKIERTTDVDARMNVSNTGSNFSRNFIYCVFLD